MNHTLWHVVNNVKNGYCVKRKYIVTKKNKQCKLFLKLLWNEGYISGFTEASKYKVKVFLKYDLTGNPALNNINFISKPSKKVYYSCKQIWKISNGKFVSIFSTNKGLLTSEQCKKKNLGGELLFGLN